MQHDELRQLIERASLEMGSQKALADHVGVSGNRITDWKTGVRECPPEKVALIADAAKLPADQWLARAVLWRQMGKPDEARLRAALGKWARVTGAALAFCTCAVIAEAIRHSTMYRKVKWREAFL